MYCQVWAVIDQVPGRMFSVHYLLSIRIISCEHYQQSDTYQRYFSFSFDSVKNDGINESHRASGPLRGTAGKEVF